VNPLKPNPVKPKIIVFLLLITSYSAIAQLTYEKRIEIELKDNYIGETLYQFGKHGFIIRTYRKNMPGKKDEWKYDLYNTDFELAKTLKVKIDSRLYADETFTNDSMVHTLFKDKNGNFSLVSIHVPNLEKTVVHGTLTRNISLSDMAILGDMAYLNAIIKKERFLLSINWKTGKKQLMPIQIDGYKSKNISMRNFQLLDDANEIFLYINASDKKKESKFFTIRLGNDGDKNEMFDFSANFTQKINSVTTYKLNEKEYIYTGTYSKEGGAPSGMLFCKGNVDKIETTNLISFSDMAFVAVEKEKEKDEESNKKSKKSSRRRSKSQSESSIHLNLAIHDIIPVDDGYLFLGEVYYPTYYTTSYIDYQTINGVTTSVTRYKTVFGGFKYTKAILAKYDLNGDLDWDKSFAMSPSYKPFYIKKFVSIAIDSNNAIKLVYANENKIVSKAIGLDGTVITETESEEIETGYSGDKVKYTFSDLDYWYGNYFLAYGSQKIKNKGNKEAGRKREIFFISKIKY
jgi:hypothetical protein